MLHNSYSDSISLSSQVCRMSHLVRPWHSTLWRANFLQILHTSQDHWLTISTIGEQHSKIKVYDSMFSSIPTLAKAQIASLLCSKDDVIETHIMEVQMQVFDYNNVTNTSSNSTIISPCLSIRQQMPVQTSPPCFYNTIYYTILWH